MRTRLLVGIGGWILCGLICASAGEKEAPGPQTGQAVIGWYNGDWQSGLPGPACFYVTKKRFFRVYDDFLVPEGGWTVVGVFSNVRTERAGVTKAAWEIRRDMAPGKAGKKVASGVRSTTRVRIPGTGPFAGDALVGYRIQVDGLKVRLEPGRYWLSVAPVAHGYTFVNATLGENAVGTPRGNNGWALVDPGPGVRFALAEAVASRGQKGIAKDFSQGVLIRATGHD